MNGPCLPHTPLAHQLEKLSNLSSPALSLLLWILVKLISAYCCGCSQSFGRGRGSALCEVVSPGKEETVNRINDHSIPGPAWSPFSDYNNNCSDWASLATAHIDGNDSEKRLNKRLSSFIPNYKGVPIVLGYDRDGKYVKTHEGKRTADALAVFAESL